MNTFNLTNYGGKYYADSREVAEKIERPHKELFRSIRTYMDKLPDSHPAKKLMAIAKLAPDKMGIVPAIAGLIFVICWLILYFSFMARGIEMMVMQIGVPLACVGLLDNDKGVFPTDLQWSRSISPASGAGSFASSS